MAGPNNHQRKNEKIHKDVQLYQVFICPKMLQHLQAIYCWHTLEALLPLVSTFLTALPQLCQLFATSHPIQLSTNFILIFICKTQFFLFSHLLASTDLMILLGAKLQALIYCLYLFLHDLHRLNLLCQVICLPWIAFKIIFIKIDIIKVNNVNIIIPISSLKDVT